ncbi:MAG: ABC transporter substrate-binding protein [Eubacteriales bacterium]
MSENKNNQTTTVKKEDAASIKEAEKRNKILLGIGVCAIIVVVALGLQLNKQQAIAEQSYIGGNMIRMANQNGDAENDIYVVNPWRNASAVDMVMFRALLQTDSAFTEIKPELVQKYEISEDGLTYILTMSENQFWSDGEPITVDDVLFSFDAFLRCTNVNSSILTSLSRIVGAKEYIAGEADTIAGISSEGNVITIQLSAPHSNFALLLTQFVPLPKHILQDEDYATLTTEHEFYINTNTVCSGMYYPASIDENNNLVLERNPHYTGEISDIETILVCWDYENLEIDYYPTSNPNEIISNRSMKGFVEHPVEVYFYRYFIFNMAGGDEGEPNVAMQDQKVRQAIYHAIDTELLMEEIYFNKTTAVYGGSIELSEKLYSYDPEKAKQLLEEAEYDFDRTFTIAYYSGDSNTAIMLEKIAEQLSEIGLTVELLQATASELYATPTYDMLLKNLSALNTEDWYNEYLSTNANLSQLLGRDGIFDDLIFNLTSTNDQDKYLGYMQDLVDLEQELLFKLPLFLLSDAVFINSNRLSVPSDMVFGNTRYRSDIRMDEWYILKA